MKGLLIFSLLNVFFFCVDANLDAQNTEKINFGNYPVDFKIWAGSNIFDTGDPTNIFVKGGYSRALSIRELFGPAAPFLTQLEQAPVTVTVESSSGNRNEFKVTMLLSVNPPNQESVRIARMQLQFQSDSVRELTYVRYVRQVNLINDKVIELRSSGGLLDDMATLSLFVGLMGMCWDTSKLGKVSPKVDPNKIIGTNIYINNLSKSDTDKIFSGTIFDVFTVELKASDYNTDEEKFFKYRKGKGIRKTIIGIKKYIKNTRYTNNSK
jgi:hypothetical protein